MYTTKNIVCEGIPSLREKSAEVKLPISNEDKQVLIDMLGYLINSQNPEKAKELNLRPGVGLASPQIGVNKKMFAIYTEDLEGVLNVLLVVNPKIIKKSKQITFLPGGEGCLSVNRETTGITPRHKEITADCYLFNLKTQKLEHKIITLKDYVAIVFQHEYDHLFGTLFVDTIMPKEKALSLGYKPLWDEEEN